MKRLRRERVMVLVPLEPTEEMFLADLKATGVNASTIRAWTKDGKYKFTTKQPIDHRAAGIAALRAAIRVGAGLMRVEDVKRGGPEPDPYGKCLSKKK